MTATVGRSIATHGLTLAGRSKGARTLACRFMFALAKNIALQCRTSRIMILKTIIRATLEGLEMW